MARFLFYLTERGLIAYRGRGRSVAVAKRFTADEQGKQDFLGWIKPHSAFPCGLLVDVSSESFHEQIIPRLGCRERNELMERKQLQLYRPTPYRRACYQAFKHEKTLHERVLYSALTCDSWLSEWLAVLEQAKQPVIGITSVAFLAEHVVRSLDVASQYLIFISLHQSYLRQTLIDPLGIKLSRRFPLDNLAGPVSDCVRNEALNAFRFLSQDRRQDMADAMEVVVLGAIDGLDIDTNEESLRYTFITPSDVARRFGMPEVPPDLSVEALYALIALHVTPENQYAPAHHLNNYRAWRIGRSMIALAACLVLLGAGLSIFLHYRHKEVARRVDAMEHQLSSVRMMYRAKRSLMDRRGLTPHEVNDAVALYRRVLHPWPRLESTLRYLAYYIQRHPDLHFEQLDWKVEPNGSMPSKQPDESRVFGSGSVNDSTYRTPNQPYILIVALSGYVVGPPHDTRQALETLERFRDDVEKTGMIRLEWTRLPLDTRDTPEHGPELASENQPPARFQSRLWLPISLFSRDSSYKPKPGRPSYG